MLTTNSRSQHWHGKGYTILKAIMWSRSKRHGLPLDEVLSLPSGATMRSSWWHDCPYVPLIQRTTVAERNQTSLACFEETHGGGLCTNCMDPHHTSKVDIRESINCRVQAKQDRIGKAVSLSHETHTPQCDADRCLDTNTRIQRSTNLLDSSTTQKKRNTYPLPTMPDTNLRSAPVGIETTVF